MATMPMGLILFSSFSDFEGMLLSEPTTSLTAGPPPLKRADNREEEYCVSYFRLILNCK